MIETTPIFDEIHKFMEATKSATPAVQKALEEFGKATYVWRDHIEEWGRQFAQNKHKFGIEMQSPAELERQARQEKKRKERENCLHGRSPFEIHMGLGVRLKCPRCYGLSVYVGPDTIICMLCGWKQRRIGKRRVKFKNG